MSVSTSRAKYAHCHGRSSLTAGWGRGVERCASERQYRHAVCKTKLTIGREREEGGNEVEREDLGAEGEQGISARGIREVVISRKQTGCQGRGGAGHNMGGCSISSELCLVNHNMCL